jgi:hypothetical protein
MGAEMAEVKPPPGYGLYSFRIHGEIYHIVLLLYPNNKSRLGYGQLYILDSAQAKTKLFKSNRRVYGRNNATSGLDVAIS